MPRNNSSGSSRQDRSLIERNRRQHMQTLYANLSSLIAPNHSHKISVPKLVDRATDYIRDLNSRVKRLVETKQAILRGDQDVSIPNITYHHQLLDSPIASSSRSRSVLPVVEVGMFESTLEVYLICDPDEMCKLAQVIRVLEEEGAIVVNSTYHNEGGRVFHTIYSQAKMPRIGIDDSRVQERLKMLFS